MDQVGGVEAVQVAANQFFAAYRGQTLAGQVDVVTRIGEQRRTVLQADHVAQFTVQRVTRDAFTKGTAKHVLLVC
ncbi:hypothetical protein D3C76_1658710 [compost metagenome]